MNLLISGTHSVLEYLIQRDDSLTQKHVQPDEDPVHDGENQVSAPRGERAAAALLQDPGEQLEAALLVPHGHLRLLHQPGGVLLLPHLDDGVEVAAAVLALGSQPPGAEHGDINMSRHPPLIIVQIYQGHHLVPLPPLNSTHAVSLTDVSDQLIERSYPPFFLSAAQKIPLQGGGNLPKFRRASVFSLQFQPLLAA